MPMDAYRIKLQSDLTLEAMHSGWLTYAASELLIEFESLKSGFNLHDFILRMSGIDLNEDFSFLYDRTHKVLRWYQRPLVN